MDVLKHLVRPMEYPEVSPPNELAGKKSADWSAMEDDRFFSWFLANETLRVERLLTFIGTRIPGDCQQWEEFLLTLGREYAERLRTPQFSCRSQDGKLQLTSQGVALAGDAGVLVGHLLTKVPGSTAHWAMVNDPGTFSHNRPVLKGNEHDLYLDPVGAIYEARALVNGRKSPDLLKNTFTFWRQRFR